MTSDPDAIARSLQRGAGSWIGEERLPPSEAAPEGIVAEGRTEARMAGGGAALVSEYTQLIGGEVTLQGVSVMVWDIDKEEYVMYWFDASGAAPTPFAGTDEDGVLTLVGPGPEGSSIRHRTEYLDDSTQRTVSDISFDGEEWMHVFEGTYRRTG